MRQSLSSPWLTALAFASALGAVALREAPRGATNAVPLQGQAAAQGDASALPTAVGAYWPDVVVTGVVLGAPSGTPGPVPGAWVIVHSPAGRCEASTHTGADGGFGRRCRDVSKAGIVELHASAPGHETYFVQEVPHSHVADDTTSGPGEINVTIVLAAETPAPEPSPTMADALTYVTLAGTVVDGGRTDTPPIDGVRVVAAYDEELGAYRCLSPVVTDATGRFEMVCPYANDLVPIRLRFMADGFVPDEASWFMGFGGRGGPRRVVLQPAPTPSPPGPTPQPGTPTATASPTDRADRLPEIDISGVVVDAGERDLPPKAGVRVVAYARPGWCGPSAVTGDGGAFALHCVDLNGRGEVELHAFDADGGRPDVWARRFDLGRAGAWGNAIRAPVAFPARPGVVPTSILEHAYYERVHGRIFDGGKPGAPPVAHAEVVLDGWGRFLSPVRTDGDGAFEIVSPWRFFFHVPITLVVAVPGGAPYRRTRMWEERLPGGLRWDVDVAADETATPSPLSSLTPPSTATPEPLGTAELPDLTIASALWAADPAVPMCAQYGPGARWATTVRVANGGPVAAGPFSVAATNLHWDVDGLGAGLTRDLTGPNGVYPAWPIVIDPENAVRESDELNNTFGPDPDRTWTPTPAATQPPTCTPTPSPTPPPSPIRLPWAGRGTLPGLP